MPNNGCHIYGFRDERQHLEDFEVKTLILSASDWNKYNGPIHLVCNSQFKEYAQSIGIDVLYDSISVVEVPKSVNQEVFWAAIKIWAYDVMPIGTTFIDIDAIMCANISEFISPDTKVLAAHFDDARGELPTRIGRLPAWARKNNTLEGINMCLVAFFDEDIRDTYVKAAKGFMLYNSVTPKDNYSNYGYMILAEQGLLLDLCKKRNVAPTYVMPVFPTPNPPMKHVWQMKGVYKQIESERNRYLLWVKNYIFAHYSDKQWQPQISMLLSGNQAKQYSK